jgi:hypothetical protein
MLVEDEFGEGVEESVQEAEHVAASEPGRGAGLLDAPPPERFEEIIHGEEGSEG